MLAGVRMERSGEQIALQSENGFKSSRLHVFTWQGDHEAVKKLLDQGADANYEADDGRTPIFSAAFYNYPTLAQLLLSYGADPNHSDKSGKTPLLLAIEWKSRAVIEVLLEARVSVGDSAVSLAQSKLGVEWASRLEYVSANYAQMKIALLMAWHSRLGQHSLIGRLPIDIGYLIISFAFNVE
uniref:Ankyrin repeat protein n=1 Tax=Palpitomonas bilix TaxID=652834 RepID=A0A7S3D4J3_9EUKA|mmetsp:Transcript_21585/g.56052  ORF Transcript_21585/g.56052 Transcript_21585/m.56052 type:complete len:183 (+) Transcript_21585:472-1020(+)